MITVPLSEDALWWFGISSLAIFTISLLSLPWLVAKIPANYFCHDNRVPSPWKEGNPAMRWGFLILKNLLGLVLLAGGIAMLILPGQGLLTMIAGLVLMDYPGKYRLERRIVSIPAIFRSLNWLRSRRGVPPLVLEED